MAPGEIGHDPSASALNSSHFKGISIEQAELMAPWSIIVNQRVPKFHFIVSGRCWLELCERSVLELKAGDFVVLPSGVSHRLSGDKNPLPAKCSELVYERLTERFSICRNHGNGTNTRFISGTFTVEESDAKVILASLPRILHVNSAQFPILEWLHCSVRLLMFESAAARPGWESAVERMTDMMLFQMIRSWKEQDRSGKSVGIAAHNDPAIDRAIYLIYSEPAFPWTIASLAKEVGLSRSAFSERFTRLVGVPMMQYVSDRRMQLAEQYLASGKKGLEEMAPLLGYQSGAAFSRAFKRSRGKPPGAVRRAFVAANLHVQVSEHSSFDGQSIDVVPIR
jgi:AraC-like DNA-binding protein/mannose-6-phosphate isomerase-like protein (cupin superfamily)